MSAKQCIYVSLPLPTDVRIDFGMFPKRKPNATRFERDFEDACAHAEVRRAINKFNYEQENEPS